MIFFFLLLLLSLFAYAPAGACEVDDRGLRVLSGHSVVALISFTYKIVHNVSSEEELVDVILPALEVDMANYLLATMPEFDGVCRRAPLVAMGENIFDREIAVMDPVLGISTRPVDKIIQGKSCSVPSLATPEVRCSIVLGAFKVFTSDRVPDLADRLRSSLDSAMSQGLLLSTHDGILQLEMRPSSDEFEEVRFYTPEEWDGSQNKTDEETSNEGVQADPVDPTNPPSAVFSNPNNTSKTNHQPQSDEVQANPGPTNPPSTASNPNEGSTTDEETNNGPQGDDCAQANPAMHSDPTNPPSTIASDPNDDSEGETPGDEEGSGSDRENEIIEGPKSGKKRGKDEPTNYTGVDLEMDDVQHGNMNTTRDKKDRGENSDFVYGSNSSQGIDERKESLDSAGKNYSEVKIDEPADDVRPGPTINSSRTHFKIVLNGIVAVFVIGWAMSMILLVFGRFQSRAGSAVDYPDEISEMTEEIA